ncbi:MAG: HemK2/MTQ2 family protein methyltransferase [Thermoplasmatota archaeon]
MKIEDDINFKISENVYEPSEDTYLLLSLVDVKKDEKVLDIGCGSGIIAIHCARNGGVVTAVDISKQAIKTTEKNALSNDVDITIKKSDLFSNINSTYDVIIFNPPYLPKHKNLKLDKRWDGGDRGDESIVKFLKNAERYLNEEGRIYMCFSDITPCDKIKKIIEERYTKVKELNKTFRFETLYAIEIHSKK